MGDLKTVPTPYMLGWCPPADTLARYDQFDITRHAVSDGRLYLFKDDELLAMFAPGVWLYLVRKEDNGD